MSSSLLGSVSLLGRGDCFCFIVGASSLLCRLHCWGPFRYWTAVIVGARSMLWRVGCCVGDIVGVGFIVRSGSLWVLVNCWSWFVVV